jgi:Ca-activated chloride channel family protein
MSLEFLNARALWTLWALLLVLGFVFWGSKRRKAILEEFGKIDLLTQFSRFPVKRRLAAQILLTALWLTLLVIVTARPLLSGISKQIRQGSLDVVAILDVSKSMAAEDCGVGVSRVEVAKDALLRCLPELAGNRLAIVTFAGKSFPQAELTDDFEALTFVLRHWVAVDSAPSQGSNVEAALLEAVDLFEKNDRKKLILLFSDGGHVRPKNLQGILTDFEARNVSVLSLGLGSPSGSKIPVYEEGVFKEWFKLDGEEAITRLNEEILREIAEGTGGKYIEMKSGRELEGIFKNPSIVGKEALSGGKEIFQVPLALSIVLLGVGMYLERRSA